MEFVVVVAVAVANIEAVEGGTDGGVVTLVEHQIYSSLSSQLELNILRVAVVLVRVAQRDPAVLVNQSTVLAVDIYVIALRIEATAAGVEVSQGALVYIRAIRERIPREPHLQDL